MPESRARQIAAKVRGGFPPYVSEYRLATAAAAIAELVALAEERDVLAERAETLETALRDISSVSALSPQAIPRVRGIARAALSAAQEKS